MDISVIIPVYNAAKFVTEAVESALAQPETTEIILVEDGSSDDSLTVCEALTAQHPKVQLFRHPDGEHQGTGASLNLGILKSQHDFLAFLHADDLYLPGRFAGARTILEAQSQVDGVYEAVGFQFEDEAARRRWFAQKWELQRAGSLRRRIDSQSLLEELCVGFYGVFHIQGLTVRRRVFQTIGLFDETLITGHATVLRMKLAATCALSPGHIMAPVALVRVHSSNQIVGRFWTLPIQGRVRIALAQGKLLRRWAHQNLDSTRCQLVQLFAGRQLVEAVCADPRVPVRLGKALKRAAMLLYGLTYPRLLRMAPFWRAVLFYGPLMMLRVWLPSFLWQRWWLIGKPMPRERVLMFHIGRTGSTVLGDLLHQHPDIQWQGEVVYRFLSPLEKEGRAKLLPPADPNTMAGIGKLIPRLDAARLLLDSMAGTRQRFYGCEVKFYHIDQLRVSLSDFVNTLHALNFRHFILLRRRNTLRVVVSALVAQKRGRHTQPANQITELTRIVLDPARISIDLSEKPLLTFLREYEVRMQHCLALLADKDVLQLTYEDDILKDPRIAYRRVCGYLGLEPCPAFVRHARSNPFRLDEIIENYDEVKQALSGTEFEWMLEDKISWF